MIGNYLKLATRHFFKYRAFSAINLTGLAAGLVTAIGLGLYIQFELSYDRFHAHADRIFRVYHTSQRDGRDLTYAKVPGPLAAFLKGKYPQIEEVARVVPVNRALVSCADKHFYEDHLILADASVLEVFSFPLVRGNPKTALQAPNALLITESAAKKYFGDEDPVGKLIRVDRKTDLVVTGILKDIPRNSHLRFEFLASMGSVESIFSKGYLDNEHNTFAYTYVRLRPGIDDESFKKKYLGLQPITRIHLYSDMGGEYEPNGSIQSIYALVAIASLVLFVACINYTNLAVALYSKRIREIGIRKVAGANRGQIVAMFLAESFLTVFVSLLLAIALAEVLLPQFSQFVERPLRFSVHNGPLVFGLAVLAVIVGLLSGAYPALFASRLEPVAALKTRWTAGGRLRLQHWLVLVQFAVFIVLTISAITVKRQVSYIQNKDLGFTREALVVVPLPDKVMQKKTEALKREFLRRPDIRSAAATSDLPGAMPWVTSVWYEGLPSGVQPPTMSFLKVDRDFIETFKVVVAQGRDFVREGATAEGHEYLVNGAAVRRLGWDEPLGKWFQSFHGGKGHVVGVIRDFHFKSLHERIEPLFLTPSVGPFAYLTVRINTGDVRGTLAFMKDTWNRLSPDSPFEFFFYDAFLDRLYRTEILFGKVTLVFSGLTILIACYGLLGLTLFAAEQRTKEIGIRKVLGASVPEITGLLVWDFAQWIALANVIAWPVAWFAMNRWLQDFAYRIKLGPGVFVLGGVSALVIALLTVSVQAVRAARANPVDALRYE